MKTITQSGAAGARRWLLYMLAVMVAWGGKVSAQTTYTIGTGTVSSSYLPIYSCYGYNYSQVIYLASELNAAGLSGPSFITKIRYKSVSPVSNSTWTAWDVYMGNTTNANFASTSAWIPSGNLTQVFSGSITQPVAGQWMEITLANPFFWDGSSNIVVGVDENTPSYTCTATWQATAATGTRSILYYNDVTNPNPTAPPTANYSTTNYANIQFDAAPAPACSGTPTGGTAAATPSAPCFNGTAAIAVNGATLATGLTYQWQQSTNGGTTWTDIASATSATYTTPPVSASIMYRRKIKCGANDSSYSTTVTVAAAVNLPPYSETFESITANNQLPTCMSATNVGSYVYTYTANQSSYNRTNHTPGGSKFASYRYGCNDFIYTPAIQLTGGQLYQFSYWYVTDGLAGWNTLQAAYGTSPTSAAQTNIVGTITTPNNSTYQQAIYQFTPATTGTYYLSIYCQSTFAPWYLTIDDINLVALPPCSGTPVAGTVTPAGPVSGCPGTQYSFTTNGTTTAANLTYQWLQHTSANTSPYWVPASGTGTTSLFFTTPNLTDTVQYRMVVTCTNSGLRDSSTIVTVNVPKVPYAAIPYTEDFESWSNRCSTTDIPSASWTNVPYTGNSSWRRNDQGSSASWTSPTYTFDPPVSAVGNYSARWHGYYAPTGNSGAGIMDLFVNCGTITGNKELQFYYKTYPGSPYPNDSVFVSMSTNGGASFTQLGAFGPNSSWSLQVLPIVSNSATTVIRFRAKDDYQYYGDIGIDYVRVLPPCSGHPTAGTVKPLTPCPNSDFQLSLLNSSQAAGLTYQWQSSPDGITWSNTTNMTNPTQAIATANVPGPYWFRCIVTCTNSTTNNVDTTAPYQFQMAPFYVCYCQSGSNPAYYNYGNVGNFKVTTQPANVTLLNNGTASPLTYNATAIANYTSFTNLPPVQMYQDSLYKFFVTEISQTYFVTGTNYGAVYLDYDRNGSFDPYERILYQNIGSNSSTQQVSDTFRVPDTASVGLTGLRVIVYPYYNTINPCGTYYYGETEDYLANIKYPPCDGPTNAGTAVSSDSAMCPGYTFMLTDTTHEYHRSGITWVWQTSTNNGGSWADVAGSTDKDTLSQVFTNTVWYRLKMVCTITGDSTYSNSVAISIKPPYKCYCYSIAVGGHNDTTDIGAMSIGNFIVNSGGPHLRNPVAVRGRTDYTDLGPLELYADTTYEVDVYHTMPNGNHADARVTLFMDFNNNLQYDIPQERVDIMPSSTTNWLSTVNNWYLVNHITIPTAVIPDVPTGMRVIINNNVGPNAPSDDACGAYTSGETEDYVVVFRKGWKTSVGEIENLKDLALFPNPTSGRFSISFNATTAVSDLQIAITNITGQQIMQQEYKNVGHSFTKELDLTTAARGVYFVEIKADGEKTIRKIVVR